MSDFKARIAAILAKRAPPPPPINHYTSAVLMMERARSRPDDGGRLVYLRPGFAHIVYPERTA